jgi:hypothetical protein
MALEWPRRISTHRRTDGDVSENQMIAGYMIKPFVGGKFKLFQDLIMNLSGKHHRIAQQECVGRNN